VQASYSRKAEGVVEITSPLGEIVLKTGTCGHCQHIFFVASGGDGTDPLNIPAEAQQLITIGKPEPPAVCHKCWSLVCPQCHATGECLTWEKQMDLIEAAARCDRSLRTAAALMTR
jgi:hypothetical protein